MVNLSIVNYTNSLPFLKGIQHLFSSDELKIHNDNPFVCAQKLINREVQIGLVPIAAIPEISNAKIISNYCIGSNGPVKSVCLLSNVKKEEIKSVVLDSQSMTSNLLVRIIAEHFWKLKINFTSDFSQEKINSTAEVVIGDRAFKHKYNFKYVFDLSEIWKAHTGLPFVFACWVSNQTLPSTLIEKLNTAFEFGVGHINEIVPNLNQQLDKETTVIEYLKNNISYSLDDSKKEAIEMFNQYAQKILNQKQIIPAT